MAQQPPRTRPIPPETLRYAAATTGISEAELLDRLEQALGQLPAEEHSAAMVAFGFAMGTPGVAAELGLSENDAEALSRSALQLLRGALADVDLDAAQSEHPRLPPRRRSTGRYLGE